VATDFSLDSKVRAQRSPDTEGLLALITPQPSGRDRFIIDVSGSVQGHVFGGLIAAQALSVAYATVDPARFAQSAHGYFLRRANPGTPIEFEVLRDTDGRSFSARRVTVMQEGLPIFTMLCSFHVPEVTTEILRPMPDDVPPPTSLPLETFVPIDDGFEIRCVLPETSDHEEDTRVPARMWVRVKGPLPEDPIVHDCLLFYASDIGTAWNIRSLSHLRVTTSLDHAIWLHRRPIRMDEWHYIDLQPGGFIDARGVYMGQIWHHDGTHVASVAQENLLRPR
jgi:acyl-CoA thioesterase